MEITTRNSNFSQFSRDLWLRAEVNSLSIDFDIGENEIKSFCLMLISLSIESLYKSNIDSSEIEELLSNAEELLSK